MARYHEIPLGELVDAIRRLHGQMCEQRTRTQAERAELAREVRQLLGALPRRIAPDPYMPHEPEYVLRKLDRETIESAYMDWYEHEVRLLRHVAITRATLHLLGEQAEDWLTRRHVGPVEQRPGMIATQSEAGLREQLRELEAYRDRAREG